MGEKLIFDDWRLNNNDKTNIYKLQVGGEEEEGEAGREKFKTLY